MTIHISPDGRVEVPIDVTARVRRKLQKAAEKAAAQRIRTLPSPRRTNRRGGYAK